MTTGSPAEASGYSPCCLRAYAPTPQSCNNALFLRSQGDVFRRTFALLGIAGKSPPTSANSSHAKQSPMCGISKSTSLIDGCPGEMLGPAN